MTIAESVAFCEIFVVAFFQTNFLPLLLQYRRAGEFVIRPLLKIQNRVGQTSLKNGI
jgi:hypothetical protein